MDFLELLAPARNLEIGIAAIDCGADAVYIAGPDFGARKAAGNSFEEIAELCNHAHKFGARVFVTYNIQIGDDELDELHRQMLRSQEAGADAFIVRDERIFGFEDIRIPLHASTQCAIRDVERAKHFRDLGSARIVLERELPLSRVREISRSVDCELEFFVQCFTQMVHLKHTSKTEILENIILKKIKDSQNIYLMILFQHSRNMIQQWDLLDNIPK